MRICQICQGFPPMAGGVETHNYSLVRDLIKKGHDVEVIVLWPKKIKKSEIELSKKGVNKGIKIHDVFPKEPLLWIFQLRNKIDQLEKIAPFDVIDIHTMSQILPFMFDKRSNIILSLHFFQFICPRVGWPLPCLFNYKKCSNKCKISPFRYYYWKFIRDLNVKRVKKLMVKYNYSKKAIVSTGFSKDKIVVVPHWTDTTLIEKLSKAKIKVPRISSKDKVFLFFGRLVEVKGPDLLLEAFAKLNKNSKNTKLVFIGDGNLKKELMLKAKKLGIKNKVLFLGRIPKQNDLYRHFFIADFIVFPHLHFNYEWALIEAMASGKPIIATKVAATKDILADKKNAVLCKPNPNSIYKAMKFALQNKSLCKQISKNALKAVKQKHHIKNLQLYEQLIKEVS